MSNEPNQEPVLNTPTDAIVHAMEHADDMEEVIVVFKLKHDTENPSKGGIGWVSCSGSRTSRLGLLAEAQAVIVADAYGWDK